MAAPRISPQPSNTVHFAHEFVKRMRAQTEIRVKPSVRQTQAIPQLLSARYFRNGHLTLDDFVDAAVRTTYPSDQELARTIAEDIVLGRDKEREIKKEQPLPAKDVKPETAALQAVMDQIRREQELASKIVRKKVQAGYEYLQKLRARKDKRLYNAATDYLTDGDIVFRGLTNNRELKLETSSELIEDMGSLSSRDIQNARTLGVLDQICNSPNAAESLAARGLRSDEGIEGDFKQLASRDPATASRALRHIEDIKALKKAQRELMDKMLQDALRNLADLSDYAGHLDRLPKHIRNHIQNAARHYQLGDAAEFSERIQQHTEKNLLDDLLSEYDRQYDEGASSNVDFRQLADTSRDSDSWKSLLEKKTQNTVHDADARSSPADYLKQMIRSLSALDDAVADGVPRSSWEKAKQKLADAAIARSATKSHLRETVRELSRQDVVPSIEGICKAGESLGMSEDEILELLNPSYRVAKALIESGVEDFERLHNLISSAKLTTKQLRELGNLATNMENQSALGAIAHENLGAALGIDSRSGRRQYAYSSPAAGAGTTDDSRTDLVFGGLLVGPATNIVKIWYAYRDALPEDIKEKLRDIAKRLLIDLGKRYARATMGSSMLGGIQQSTAVRPFRIGDDIDLIDLEETIDSLLSQGRVDFNVLNVDDFLICETYQGHRAFVWALDKSGSMDSPNKLGMLSISVMAGLYGVQKDDFGVILFDSVSHIVKRVDEKSASVEKVASDLLDVRAGGGTGGRVSLQWALENFEQTRAKERICIFATDAFLSDQRECERLAEKMKHHEIKLIILVPKESYDVRAADSLAKKSHGVVLDIGDVEELPEKLLKLTDY
ncbi:MAG: hypothetical protein ACE5H4_09285 [Candidatus Thorarchaeota archaeon]